MAGNPEIRRQLDPEDGGSDVERNLSLLTGRDGGKPGTSSHTGEEGWSSDEEEGDSEASDDEADEDHDGGVGGTEIRTREDMKKGALLPGGSRKVEWTKSRVKGRVSLSALLSNQSSPTCPLRTS